MPCLPMEFYNTVHIVYSLLVYQAFGMFIHIILVTLANEARTIRCRLGVGWADAQITAASHKSEPEDVKLTD